jgi:hypothetical protein
MYKQPYYTIDFSAAACMFEIRVNDIAVITLNIEGQAATMVPINYAILDSGKQAITATVLPLHGKKLLDPNAEFKYTIRLFDVTNGFKFLEELPGYQFPKVDIEKSLPIMAYSSAFTATIPYTLIGWKAGENLKNISDISTKLVKAYNEVANLLSNKEYDLFAKKIANREKIICTAMYLNVAEAEGRIKSIITDCEDGFKVMPIPKDALMVQYGNGKIATLKRASGESALFLINDKTQEELAIEISFYIPAGKTEFEVI